MIGGRQLYEKIFIGLIAIGAAIWFTGSTVAWAADTTVTDPKSVVTYGFSGTNLILQTYKADLPQLYTSVDWDSPSDYQFDEYPDDASVETSHIDQVYGIGFNLQKQETWYLQDQLENVSTQRYTPASEWGILPLDFDNSATSLQLNCTTTVHYLVEGTDKDAVAPYKLNYPIPTILEDGTDTTSEISTTASDFKTELSEAKPTLKGYTFKSMGDFKYADKDGVKSSDFPTDVTYYYSRNSPVTPPENNENAASSSASAMTSSDTLVTSELPQQVTAFKKRSIMVTKKMGLYNEPTFTSKSRMFYYAKASRTKRPQLIVTGLAQSVNGRTRYLVRDVTAGSKYRGETGYITAVKGFTTPTYYQHNPQQVKILAKSGVNVYRNKNLTQRVGHLKKGKVVHVKRIMHYHLTTRLVLTDGSFITANKAYVIKK